MDQIITVFDIIGLISSITSLVLAIIAIWLSLYFFKISSAAAQKTDNAAMEISMHVKKLETLFDKLYSDTFSVVKETVSDMRKQLWSEKTSSNDTSKIDAEAEKKAEGKIKEIKKDFKEELAQIFDTKHIDKNVTNNEIKNIRKELLESFEKAITESRNIDLEAREKTLKDFIRKFIKKKLSCINNGTATAKDFLPWIKQEGLAPKLVFKEIEEMSKEGKLNTSHEKITGPYVEIRMN